MFEKKKNEEVRSSCKRTSGNRKKEKNKTKNSKTLVGKKLTSQLKTL